VTQDEDLRVLGGVPAGEQGEQLEGAAQREVGEFRQHQVSSAMGAEAPPYRPTRPSKLQLTAHVRVCAPFRLAPQEVHQQPTVQRLVVELLHRERRTTRPQLRELATRVGVLAA
jgi:hypothetical protein